MVGCQTILEILGESDMDRVAHPDHAYTRQSRPTVPRGRRVDRKGDIYALQVAVSGKDVFPWEDVNTVGGSPGVSVIQ